MPRTNVDVTRWNGWNDVVRRSGGVVGGIRVRGVTVVIDTVEVVGGTEEREKVVRGGASRGVGVDQILGRRVEIEVVLGRHRN